MSCSGMGPWEETRVDLWLLPLSHLNHYLGKIDLDLFKVAGVNLSGDLGFQLNPVVVSLL